MTVLLLLLCFLAAPASAHLALPKWFGDHMVLQTDEENGVHSYINGKAEPGETIQVKVVIAHNNNNNNNQQGHNEYKARVNSAGDWKVRLDANVQDEYPGEVVVTIEVTGSDSDNTVVANFVSFGDVFMCSGQSNMVFPLKLAFNPQEEAETLQQFPNFRFFVTERGFANHPEWDLPTEGVCDIDGQVDGKHGCNRWVTQQEALQEVPDIEVNYILEFSAVCFMTVRDIAKMHSSIGSKRPVGLIQTAWTGSNVEAWMSKEAIEATPFATQLPKKENDPNQGHKPSVLYNAMMHPWNDYAVRAVLWDQGEGNANQILEGYLKADPNQYYSAMYQSMIADWRAKKNIGDFAWGTVQLPPSVASNTKLEEQLQDGRMEVRVAQADTVITGGTTENCALAVTLDLGGASRWRYNHQPNKNEMARRLALGILHVAYDHQGPLWTGPVFQTARSKKDSTVVLQFSEIGSGMNLRDVKAANINGTRNDCTRCCAQQPPFEVQIDREWIMVPRDATSVQDKSVVLDLSSLVMGMDAATSVRYAWSDYVDCVLENSEGLVASPFVQSIVPTSARRR